MTRPLVSLGALAAAMVTAISAQSFTLWNDIRTSALLPGDAVTLRTESVRGAGLSNTILYADELGVQEVAFTPVADGPSTLEATVPGPLATRRYYGFRLVQGEEMDLLPVRLGEGATPGRDDFTLLADDPVGDEAFGRPHLDLTACRISRDGTRLYAALSNAGGGFPVSSGLTFFSYLLAIKDPAVAVPDTLFGMIHTVTAAGIIEPGLYQINGDGVNDLNKIGEITATELAGENTLVLSCLLADLEGNPVFQSWYDAADPRIDVAAFSQRITLLSGTQDADATLGAVWHLREVALDPFANTPPALSDLDVPQGGAGGFASVVYTDAEAHCPVAAELVFDGTDTYPLFPQTLDYAGPVTYRSTPDLPPLLAGDWSRATVRFSDNAVDTVELTQAVSGVSDSRAGLQVRASPNPSSGRVDFALALPETRAVQLAVYDLAGRHVVTLVAGTLPAGDHGVTWDGRGADGRPQPAGVYFYHLRGGGDDVVRRLTLVR